MMADGTNLFDEIIKDATKVDNEIWEKYLPQSVLDQHQAWIEELRAQAKALATAKKTGNYSRFAKVLEKSRAVAVKIEKISENLSEKENNEDMPAPTIIPPKKKAKKEKKSKTRNTSVDHSQTRSSDVIIQEPVISTIDLSDSEDQPARSIRSSRLRTKKPTADVNVSAATNSSNVTEYEDASSSVNSTFTLPKKANEIKKEKMSIIAAKPLLNETVVVSKPKMVQGLASNANALLTDDESIEEPAAGKTAKKDGKNDKRVLAPYGDSPVKRKVEQFENMQHEATTNTKANTSTTLKQIELKKGNVKEKAQGCTPVASSKLPQKVGTPLSSLRSRTPLGRIGIEKTSIVSSSRTIESSAQKKKRHEEAYIKAKQKEVEDRERIREMAKQKEERTKLILQQKEEKIRQMREEQEKKRLLAKQKAEEQRKKEMMEMKRNEQPSENVSPKKLLKKKAPIYMLQSLPRLPCADCYDSEEEEGKNRTKTKPLWASGYYRTNQEQFQEFVGHKIKNTMFCCQSRNVDLRDLFGSVEPRKLKRTSSANWERPPRFTMLME